MITITQVKKYRPKTTTESFIKTAISQNYQILKSTSKNGKARKYFVKHDDAEKFAQEIDAYVKMIRGSRYNNISNFKYVQNQEMQDKLVGDGFISLSMLCAEFPITRNTALKFAEFCGWESKRISLDHIPQDSNMFIFKATITEAKNEFDNFLVQKLKLSRDIAIIEPNQKNWHCSRHLQKLCNVGYSRLKEVANSNNWKVGMIKYSEKGTKYYNISVSQAKKQIAEFCNEYSNLEECDINEFPSYFKIKNPTQKLESQIELDLTDQAITNDIYDPNYIWFYKCINLGYKYEFIGISDGDINASNLLYYFKPKKGGEEVGFKSIHFSEDNQKDVLKHFDVDKA